MVGPNGAGKTTLLSIIAGVQRASAGSVGGAAALAGGRAIGWAPQQPALYSKLSVRENLRLFARLERVADAEAAVARMLEQTGLARARRRARRRASPAATASASTSRSGCSPTRPCSRSTSPRRRSTRPARAAVGVRRRRSPRAGRACCSRRTTRRGAGATPRGRSCWPTGELLFDGPPADAARRRAGRRRRDLEGAFVGVPRSERGHA